MKRLVCPVLPSLGCRRKRTRDDRGVRGSMSRTAPEDSHQLLMTPVEMNKIRKGSKHKLVNSDFTASVRLNLLRVSICSSVSTRNEILWYFTSPSTIALTYFMLPPEPPPPATGIARGTRTQINKFLDKNVPFYVITDWPCDGKTMHTAEVRRRSGSFQAMTRKNCS